MNATIFALLLLTNLTVACCNQRTNSPSARFAFANLDAGKILEIAFLEPKDVWGEGDELVAVAPPIRSSHEIFSFVGAAKLDLPAERGAEHLAGVVCTIAILGKGEKVIDTATLFAANAVIGPSQVTYSASSGVYKSSADSSVDSRLLPRKAPNFGKYVLNYFRHHEPEKYKGVWFVKVEN